MRYRTSERGTKLTFMEFAEALDTRSYDHSDVAISLHFLRQMGTRIKGIVILGKGNR